MSVTASEDDISDEVSDSEDDVSSSESGFEEHDFAVIDDTAENDIENDFEYVFNNCATRHHLMNDKVV